MLVLSRKKNEQIVIDENVVVTVLQIRGDRIRVGIEAPEDVPVHRKEVQEAMKREQAQKKAREEGSRQR
jgi:carbon storage regulator